MISGKNNFFTEEILSELVAGINVAFWVWDMSKDELYYNEGYFDLVGHPHQEGPLDFKIWSELLHPKDCARATQLLKDYCDGKTNHYTAEFRVIKSNGDIIWIYDVGKITKRDENGNPIQVAGIIQDITKRKTYEEQLKKDENKLRLAMQFAGFSVWEWDITSKNIIYDNEYAKSLGYKNEDFTTQINDWANIIHPDDILNIASNIRRCLTGQGGGYDLKLRVKKADNTYIWVRDIAEVSEVNELGQPIKIIGGRLDIHELEMATLKLEGYHEDLEKEIKQRTKELQKRDQSLIELNQISKKIMETPTGVDFNKVIFDCLDSFSSFGETSRLTIFRNKLVDDKPYCYLTNNNKTIYKNEFTMEYISEIFDDVPVDYISGGAFNEDQREDYYKLIHQVISSVSFDHIDYSKYFPTIYKHVQMNKTLNFNTNDVYRIEFIFARLQGVKSMMMSPISINNEPWGFILLDNPLENAFDEEDAKILNLVGSVLGQAIHKNELEVKANEAIEHNELMLNSMPFGCNLWFDGQVINYNEEILRLFDLDDRRLYLEYLEKLSPEYQPNGKKTSDLISGCLKIAEEQGRHRFEFMHNKLNGELIPCEVTLVKIDYKNSFLIAGYIRDLTEHKALMKRIEETQENLKQAHEEAILSSQAKSNFLANMSHEIRTPMNAISGMTDIILRETKNQEIESYAVNIKRASETLLAIINDVLDISKIESGKLDIVEGEYSLVDTLNDVLTIAINRLELKPLMFTANFQNDLPDKLIGDDVRVKQIMVNILNNAIKFTSEGSISFNVWGEYAGGILELKFSITDTGVGISEDDIEKLFIEFERVNTKKNRSIEGTGLGLAISKRLCEMMNGNIEIVSEIGKGTTFTITLVQQYTDYSPIAQIENQKSVLVFESRDLYRNSIIQACEDLELEDVVYCALQSECNEALQDKKFDFVFTSAVYLLKVQELINRYNLDSKIVLLADSNDIKSKYDYTTIILPTNSISISDVINGKNKTNNNNKNQNNFTAPECTVLVVDDNLVNLKVAQGLMRPYLFKIDTAENGKEAVLKIKNNKYDLVFMDHMMPIMDGIDATTSIRSIKEDYYQNLPIIALTANAIIGTREMFISEGMNDFLAKPIKTSSLNEVLSKWLPIEKQILENDSVGKEISQEPLDETKIDVELTIQNVDIKLGMQRVGGDFDTYVDILHMYYKDGLKRVHSIRDMFDQKALVDYKIEVHALKSASASVGAMDISEKARLLEEAAIKSDWTYINQNALEFIDDFNILLENIRESLIGVVSESDNSTKQKGDVEFYINSLNELSTALDTVDINICDELMEKLLSFSWSEEQNDNLNKIYEYISGYEYDEAMEIVKTLI